MKIKILVMVSLAVCSLSVNAKSLRTTTKAKVLATTTKQAVCVATNGLCHVECDGGMVVVGGGCVINPWTVGISASFPSGPSQWACRPTVTAAWIYAYAICQ